MCSSCRWSRKYERPLRVEGRLAHSCEQPLFGASPAPLRRLLLQCLGITQSSTTRGPYQDSPPGTCAVSLSSCLTFFSIQNNIMYGMCTAQVVFSPFGTLHVGSGGAVDKDVEEQRLFLVVYLHGNSIWAGPPSSLVCPIALVDFSNSMDHIKTLSPSVTSNSRMSSWKWESDL